MTGCLPAAIQIPPIPAALCKPRSVLCPPLTHGSLVSGWPLPGPRRVASGESAAAGGPGGTLCRVPRLPAVPEGGQDGQDPVGVYRPSEHPGPASGGAERVGDPDQVGLHADPGVTQPGECRTREGKDAHYTASLSGSFWWLPPSLPPSDGWSAVLSPPRGPGEG